MLILSRVCADFYDQNRNLLHKITQADLGLFHDAPESIKQDPLFQMLVDDKSIKFPEDALTNRALENDPMAGSDASGKEIKARTTRSKAEPKSETKPETKVETKSETKTDPAPADQPAETKGK